MRNAFGILCFLIVVATTVGCASRNAPAQTGVQTSEPSATPTVSAFLKTTSVTEAQSRLHFRIILPTNLPPSLPPLGELRTFSRPDLPHSQVQMYYQKPGVPSEQALGLWIWEIRPPVRLTSVGYEQHTLSGIEVYVFVSDVQRSPRIGQLPPPDSFQRPDDPRIARGRAPSRIPSTDAWWIQQDVEFRFTIWGYEPDVALSMIRSMVKSGE